MATPNPEHLEYMMYLDEAIRQVEKKIPENPKVKLLKLKFLELAGNEFDRSVLKEVHEYTIEEIIIKQANGFYNDQYPKPIKNELIGWYSEMEHQHRRNNFLKFSESVFQQIECFVNFIVLNQKAIDYVAQRFDSNFINNDKPIIVGKSIFDSRINNSTELTISFLRSDKATIKTKFKMALYIYFFDGNIYYSPYKKILDTFEEIRQVRNFFHGFKLSDLEHKTLHGQDLDWDQKIVHDVRLKGYIKFLSYQGFLAEFNEKVLSSRNYKNFL